MYSQTEREERGQGQTQLKLATRPGQSGLHDICTTDSNVEQKLILSSQQIQVTQL